MKKSKKQNFISRVGHLSVKIAYICGIIIAVSTMFSLICFADEDIVKVNTAELDINHSKKVLILNSYHHGHPWTDGVTKGILETFAERNVNIEVHIENMDTKRIADTTSWMDMLKQKLDAYPNGYLDLIIVSGDNALNTLYKIGHHYHTIPIVYCGISENEAWYSDLCSMFIEVKEYLPFKENIELGLRLFPNTEHIAIVTDRSKTGASCLYAAKKSLKDMDLGTKDIIWLNGYDGLNTAELNYRLSNLPENTIVILSIWQIDGEGKFWDPVKYYPILAEHSNAPIFTVTDIGINNAFLGGLVSVSTIQGKLAAEKCIQILFGEILENISSIEDKNKYCFNWEQLKKWNIKLCDIPSEAIIVNKPETIYDQYRTYFLFTLVLIILLFLLLGMLLLYHFRYRNYEIQRTKMARKTKRLADRYNILFKQANNAIVIFELKTGVVTSFNDKALEMFKIHEEHFKHYSLKKHFDNYEKLRSNIKNLLEAPFELEMFRWDGSKFYSQVILNILKEGGNDYVYAIITDVSKRREQEIELRVSKARLNETLLNSKNSYWEWDLVNNVLLKDDNFWLALDVDPKTLKENPIESSYYLNSIHPDDQDGFIETLNKAINGEQDTILHEMRMSFFGEDIWVEIRAVVASRDENGKGLMINGFMMNIDERKKQEKELIKAKERSEESDRLKSAFISNISHEIRTPLNGIVGFSNLLGRENLSIEDKRKYLSFINENNDLLLKLINDILEISKIEADSLSIREVPCNLMTLCDDILVQERITLAPTVTLSLAEVQNINVQIDKINLTRVIRNLLSNAKKFTPQGKIELGFNLNRDNLEFYVRDTGIGIPENMIEQVFDRFVQVDPFSSGTGLGLSISKAIIEKMGGKIWLESKPGKGTCAYFILKYKKAKIMIDEVEPIAKENEISDENKKKVRILIAEDDESSFVLLNIVLTGKYQVIRVFKAKDISSFIHQYKPGILLVNIDMPGFDEDTIEAIRKISPETPIIGITDKTLDFARNKEIEDTMDERISKPINIKSLISIIEEQLNNN